MMTDHERDRAVRALTAATTPGPDELARLELDLAAAAEREGVLDVAYRTIDTPLGTMLVAATQRGLVRVAFQREGFDDVLQRLAEAISPRILHSNRRLDAAARELAEYFSGARTGFDLPLDWSLTRGFRQQVQRHLPDIPYGRTESYSQVAQAVGNPRAVRAVGTACATNPLPIVLPCHRVLRSDGSVGGYLGGPEAKSALLALESGQHPHVSW